MSVITTKSCMRCGGSLPSYIVVGMDCPHCGARFGSEVTTEHEDSKTKKEIIFDRIYAAIGFATLAFIVIGPIIVNIGGILSKPFCERVFNPLYNLRATFHNGPLSGFLGTILQFLIRAILFLSSPVNVFIGIYIARYRKDPLQKALSIAFALLNLAICLVLALALANVLSPPFF